MFGARMDTVVFAGKLEECALKGYGSCRGRIHRHHWINRAKLRGNKKAKAYTDKFADYFLVPVCAKHNLTIADTKWARRVILERLVALHGVGVCRAVLDGIPWKISNPEMSYFGIMAGPTKEKWRDGRG
jgi:hypothetical protein